MEIYPILNKPGKGKYVFIFILNERAVRAGVATAIRGRLPAPATDLRLHMAQMQVLQPLPRHTIPNVASLGGRGRP